MENLGESFIEGRIVNLDQANVDDLKVYLESVRKSKKEKKDKMDDLLQEIYN